MLQEAARLFHKPWGRMTPPADIPALGESCIDCDPAFD
jgi:hypothetical protein